MTLALLSAVTIKNGTLPYFFQQARSLQASQPVQAWTFLSLYIIDRDYQKTTHYLLI